MHEVSERLEPELHPLAEIGVREVAQLQILLGIQPRLLPECRYRLVIEAGPSVFPSVKVRHPVRNVDIDPIDSRARDLPHPLHVDLAPLAGIRRHPNVFIALPDPKRRTPAEDSGLPGDLPL